MKKYDEYIIISFCYLILRHFLLSLTKRISTRNKGFDSVVVRVFLINDQQDRFASTMTTN